LLFSPGAFCFRMQLNTFFTYWSAIHPSSAHLNSCLLTSWSDAFRCLCESCCFVVGAGVT
jgi:hypothetical protein